MGRTVTHNPQIVTKSQWMVINLIYRHDTNALVFSNVNGRKPREYGMSRQFANAISFERREVPPSDVNRPKTYLDLPCSIRQKHNLQLITQPAAESHTHW